MRQYVVTDVEMQALIDQLQLIKLRELSAHAPQSSIHKQDIEDLHRTFHFHVVRWTQDIGYRGFR